MQKLLATILVANNFINTGARTLFAFPLTGKYRNHEVKLNFIINELNIDVIFLIEVFVITFALLFGEITKALQIEII